MRKPLSLSLAAAVLSLAGASASEAATAHNSQAGSYGPNSHTCAPTPYFPEAGGCLAVDALDGRGDALPLGGLYRPDPRGSARRAPARRDLTLPPDE